MLISKPERSNEKNVDMLKDYKMDIDFAIRLQQEQISSINMDIQGEMDYGS